MEAPGYVAWAGTIPPDGAIAAERELYASIVEVKIVDHRQSSVRIGIESPRVVNVAEGLCRTRVGIHFIEYAERGSHENFPVSPQELSRALLNFAERGGATLWLRSLRPLGVSTERPPLGGYRHSGPPPQDRS